MIIMSGITVHVHVLGLVRVVNMKMVATYTRMHVLPCIGGGRPYRPNLPCEEALRNY